MHAPDECDDATRALDQTAEEDLTSLDVGPTPTPVPGSGAGSDTATDTEPIDELGAYGPPRVGQVLYGRYVVEQQIGEGGMGTVWLVRHLELDTLRALKLIVLGIADDPEMRARFRREARAMARLSHPNAVAVHDARIGREAAFIEMDYVRGKSLNRLLTPGVPMPMDWVARIVEQLCDVLQEAHNQKIVHRDLKPSNLMLVADRPPRKELLKVLDFGIAKILESDAEADVESAVSDVRTLTGVFLGSAPWSSPEQVTGGVVDHRSDIYSVGIILYELLTGSRPFSGPFVRQIYDHVHTPAPRFAAINPNIAVPPAVEQVVLRCLAKNPEDRPQSAQDLAAELLWAISDDSGASLLEEPPTVPLPGPGDPERTFAIFGDSQVDAPVRVSPVALADTGAPGAEPLTEPQSMQTTPLGLDPCWTETEVGSTIEGDGFAADRDDASSVATYPPGKTGTGIEPGRTAPRRAPRSRRRRVTQVTVLACLLVGALFLWSAWTATLRVPEGYRAEGVTPGSRLPATLVRIRDGVRFLHMPGGTFTMGNAEFDRTGSLADEDQPAHPVLLSDYYLQENEVTNVEMDAYFRENKIDKSKRPARFQQAWDQIVNGGADPASYPAVGVSHELAAAYAAWVGGKLPTEAQWEYSARSLGQPRRFVWPGDERPNSRNANIDSRGNNIYFTTSVVGSNAKDVTDQGIHDMTGNVREWCRDRWSEYQPSEAALHDPEGPDRSDAGPLDFVIRGGSFASWKDQFRTTRPRRLDRDDPSARQLEEDKTADDVGFRVVIEWPPKR